jgi:hypothetical protein
VIALLLAAAWEWALLWIALLAFGCWAVMRVTQRAADVGSDNSGEINSAQEIVGQESAGQEAVGPESAVKVAAGFAEFNAAIGAATEHETPRESGLIMLAAAALLVILLGTWQHVVEHEGQRLTRSTRYSAWPRATALANAWERSGWVVKRDEHSPQQFDRASVELMARTASREQNIAWGLGVMLLVVAGVAWRQSNDRVDASENSQEVSHGN